MHMVLKKEEIDPIMEKVGYSYIGDKLNLFPANKKYENIIILVNNELRVFTSVFVALLIGALAFTIGYIKYQISKSNK